MARRDHQPDSRRRSTEAEPGQHPPGRPSLPPRPSDPDHLGVDPRDHVQRGGR
jgi:hypothetical protein